ncbi:hypothetical protein Sgly_0371 [Syntrophobotulus glycolicus DSM 8271]|uniref:DUF1490 domain-containing protein n=1 Tax=Syntrophobotulus glycolicus (strain DSM 8271 / FlGlyR) TaxID=645991 RepID=F0SXJ1_SYNGF|nr:DUF6110 family protein [Syntrophobotulus glycolicus]ADY54737.1 hypothetical protein Sgly_0371 [Syntrophobotulus glycolicus DSM 8271]
MKINVDKKNLVFFTGGAVASLVALKFLKSKKARKIGVKTLAKGLRFKDEVQAAALSIKEEAEDLVSEIRVKAKDADLASE